MGSGSSYGHLGNEANALEIRCAPLSSERGAFFILVLSVPVWLDKTYQSVYEIMETFLKSAKKRRQIIMVTHNPNLAVVADAEQIVHVGIDKKNEGNDFRFYGGSIEDAEINKKVVDILEGTLPAFDNRRLKYCRQK